jgi:hypothetical protein
VLTGKKCELYNLLGVRSLKLSCRGAGQWELALALVSSLMYHLRSPKQSAEKEETRNE